MSSPSTFASTLIETGASALAGAAASQLIEQHPEIGERYGATALDHWRFHLTQRLIDLSASLEAEESVLFTARILWERKAFRARDLLAKDLKYALESMHQVLADQLPTRAWDAAEPYLDAALESLGEPVVADTKMGLDPDVDLDRLALLYIKSALEGDSAAAIELVVRAVDNGLSLLDAYAGVLIAAQREVGTLWHLGELNVAEEHLVTSTTERTLAILAERSPRQEPVGKTVLAATVVGNRHGLGIRILSDLFAVAGWRSICLGVDVPAADLAASSAFFNADLVLLSTSLPSQLRDTMRGIDALRAVPDRSVKILVGGAIFQEVPSLWRRLGADGHAAELEAIIALGFGQVGLATP